MDRAGANSYCKMDTRGISIAGAVMPHPKTSLMGQKNPALLRTKSQGFFPFLCSSPTQLCWQSPRADQTQSLKGHLSPTAPVPLAPMTRWHRCPPAGYGALPSSCSSKVVSKALFEDCGLLTGQGGRMKHVLKCQICLGMWWWGIILINI